MSTSQQAPHWRGQAETSDFSRGGCNGDAVPHNPQAVPEQTSRCFSIRFPCSVSSRKQFAQAQAISKSGWNL